MDSINEYLEEVIEQCGGLGYFQWFIIAVIIGSKITITWSMLMMTFGGATPDWWCTWFNSSSPVYRLNATVESLKTCVPPESASTLTCSAFSFSTELKTVVSEWNLICDKEWTTATITTIQMAGLLLSGFLAGQLADFIGRKPTYFLSLLCLIACNIISAFCVSWQMFAVLRFFIGVGCGCYLTVFFTFVVEFTPKKYRPMLMAIPAWPIFAALYALVSWWLHDWKFLHVATAIVTVPFLFSWFFMPESFRWLVSHNKLDEAELVLQKIAKFNGKPEIDTNRLRLLAKQESLEEQKHFFSLLDIFKSWDLTKKTICLAFIWFSCGYGYYAISFGVDELSGSLYLNMFLLSIVEVPAQSITWFFNNCIGRRWTCFLFFIIAALAGTAVGVVQVIDTPYENSLVNGFAMTAKLGVAAAWAAVMIFTTETYPTVVRNIGYGTVNSVSRVGAMIAPQIVRLNKSTSGLMYFVFGAVMLLSGIFALPLPETKNKALLDNLVSKQKIPGSIGKHDNYELHEKRDVNDIHITV